MSFEAKQCWYGLPGYNRYNGISLLHHNAHLVVLTFHNWFVIEKVNVVVIVVALRMTTSKCGKHEHEYVKSGDGDGNVVQFRRHW